MRVLVAWVLGLVGVGAAGYGVFRPWYEDRVGVAVPLADLFAGVERESAPLVASMGLPVLLGLLLVVVGLVVSAPLAQLGGALVVVSAGWWVVRVQEAVDLTALQVGLWNTLFGGLLALVAGFLRAGRS